MDPSTSVISVRSRGDMGGWSKAGVVSDVSDSEDNKEGRSGRRREKRREGVPEEKGWVTGRDGTEITSSDQPPVNAFSSVCQWTVT